MNEELTEEEKALLQELLDKRKEEKKFRLYIEVKHERLAYTGKRYVSVKDEYDGEFEFLEEKDTKNATEFTAEEYPHWKNDFMQVEELHYKLEPDWK